MNALRRHHRDRVIARRLRIIRFRDPRSPLGAWVVAGRYDKHNLACSCWACSKHLKERFLRHRERQHARREIAGAVP